MTPREAESFAAGVSVWDEILPRAPRDDEGAIARRFCGCLMLHQLYLTIVAEPRRDHRGLSILLDFLSKRPI